VHVRLLSVLVAGPDGRLRVKVQVAPCDRDKSCSPVTPSGSPSRGRGSAVSLRRFSMSSVPSAVMIRRAGRLSNRMMTGQPPGAKQVAIASARTPAQSRNVTPARSRTSRSIRSSRTRAACWRNSSAATRSSEPPRISVQTGPSRTALTVRSSAPIASQSARGVWTTPTEVTAQVIAAPARLQRAATRSARRPRDPSVLQRADAE
jgi:hypothetical protein